MILIFRSGIEKPNRTRNEEIEPGPDGSPLRVSPAPAEGGGEQVSKCSLRETTFGAKELA